MHETGKGEPFYGNCSTLDSHTNIVISHTLPTRQHGAENRDKVYSTLFSSRRIRALGVF